MDVPEEQDQQLGEVAGLLLHYRIPQYLEGHVEPGHLVAVSLRGRPAFGVVVDLDHTSPVEVTQPITRLVDARPVVAPVMLELARWIAAYYRCTLYAPWPWRTPGVARRAVTTVGLSNAALPADGDDDPLIEALGRRQRQVVALLQNAPHTTLTLNRLKRKYTGPKWGWKAPCAPWSARGLSPARRRYLPTLQTPPGAHRPPLAADADRVTEALRDAASRAPLQAAALTWLLHRPELEIGQQGSGVLQGTAQGSTTTEASRGTPKRRNTKEAGSYCATSICTPELPPLPSPLWSAKDWLS